MKSKGKLVIGIVIGSVLFIVSIFVSYSEYRFIKILEEKYTESVDGIVVEKDNPEKGSSTWVFPIYKVSYEYNGKNYIVTNRNGTYSDYPIGKRLAVKVNPNKPKQAVIDIYTETHDEFYNSLILLAFSFILVTILSIYKLLNNTPDSIEDI